MNTVPSSSSEVVVTEGDYEELIINRDSASEQVWKKSKVQVERCLTERTKPLGRGAEGLLSFY